MSELNLNNASKFEMDMKSYLSEAKERLDTEFQGTREAIKMIASEKTKEYIQFIDKGLDKKERELLSAVCTAAMYQAFCYGYGIGKVEGSTQRKVYL